MDERNLKFLRSLREPGLGETIFRETCSLHNYPYVVSASEKKTLVLSTLKANATESLLTLFYLDDPLPQYSLQVNQNVEK